MSSYDHVPQPADAHLSRELGSAAASRTDFNTGTGVADFAEHDNEAVAQHDAPLAEEVHDVERPASAASNAAGLGRSNTLKKKTSVSRKTSLKHSGTRKSVRAPSVKAAGGTDGVDDEHYNNAFFTPIPTTGTPTDVLANRFQAWRTFLKTLIGYYREVQTSFDQRSKAILKVSNVIGNSSSPSLFMADGGISDGLRVLRDYHKHSQTESTKASDIERDVIAALTGLRADLNAKIKEIKSLSGDFKNSVAKEQSNTKSAVSSLEEALQHFDHVERDDKGANDPYLVRLGVDRSLEKQIDEENYLHRAYLNLEASGRELEQIVVGEIQKSYNALAGILRREGDDSYQAVEQLREGPIAMPKDFEWNQFVRSDPHFINPEMPLRRVEDIIYPGKNHPAAIEVRAGMLERKSKYLKSYTPGWYVLSPTHLHEFKSADKIYSQPPVMSLYLLDQKLGSHSAPDSSSHKFMLKGRQTGSMHRGHSWVFRAESYETMMTWFDAIKNLTEKTGAERNAFVRAHARSVSGNAHRPMSITSDGDGLEEDEADQVPFSTNVIAEEPVVEESRQVRPQPGGRFPSDINVNREAALTPTSSDEAEDDHDTIAAVAMLPGSTLAVPGITQQREVANDQYETDPYRLEGVATHTGGTYDQENAAEQAPEAVTTTQPMYNDMYATTTARRLNPSSTQDREQEPQQQEPQQQQYDQDRYPQVTQTFILPVQTQQPTNQVQQPQEATTQPTGQVSQPQAPEQTQQAPQPVRHDSEYRSWLAPAAVGAGAGVLGEEAYRHHTQSQNFSVLNPPPQTTEQDRGGFSSAVIAEEPFSSATRDSATYSQPSSSSFTDSTAPTSVSGAGSGSGASELGGLENKGAHPTGRLFPKVVRHNTDMSVSNLHVPGEFPKGGGSGSSAWDMARE